MNVICMGFLYSVFGLLALFCSAAYAQSPAEFILSMKLNAENYIELANNPDEVEELVGVLREQKIDVKEFKETLNELKNEKTAAVVTAKAVTTVLKKPEEFSTVILYCAARRESMRDAQIRHANRDGKPSVAQQKAADKHLENSAYLFYAAQLRARFDEQCFPPKGTGGDSPLVLFAALSQTVGSTVNPAIAGQPKLFEKVLDRLKQWKPKAQESYHPGYEFNARITEQAAHEAAKENREDFLNHMTGYCTLLNIPEYFAAHRTVRAFKLGVDGKQPSEEAADKAVETIIRIEKDKGIKILTDSLQK